MTTQDLLQPLHEIHERIQEMVRLAQAEAWSELEAQSTQYQQQVALLNDESFYRALTDANLVIEARGLIAQIQVLNDGLDLHASNMRDKIASELRQMRQSDKALDAYGR